MYAKPADLAEALRKPQFVGGEQAAAERCLDSAAAEIDAWLDRYDHEPLAADVVSLQDWALVKSVNIARAVEWWKANDAAFGMVGYADIGVLRAPKDGFLRHGLTIVHLKELWGVA